MPRDLRCSGRRFLPFFVCGLRELPNQPNAHTTLKGREDDCTRNLVERFESRGLVASRYLVIGESGRARHATLSCRDARNGIAVRHGVPVLLLEGRD